MADEQKPGERQRDIFARAPQRHLSETEKEFIRLKIEQTKIERERAQSVLDKGMLLYFGTLLVTVLGNIYEFIPAEFTNLLVIAGVCILALSAIPYIKVSKKSEATLQEMMDALVGKL